MLLANEQAQEGDICQGYHGKYEANCRCCLPALAGFVSPHSVDPDVEKLSIGDFPFKVIGKKMISTLEYWNLFLQTTQ